MSAMVGPPANSACLRSKFARRLNGVLTEAGP